MFAETALLLANLAISAVAPGPPRPVSPNTPHRNEIQNSSCPTPSNLSVSERQIVIFGMISDASRRCTMEDYGVLSGDCVGTGYLGEMVVSGDPYLSFGVSVSSHGWQNDAKFSPKLTNQSYVLNANGEFVVYVKGTMQLKSKVVIHDEVNMTYTFTVYYQ